MITREFYEADGLFVRIPVMDDAGAPVTLFIGAAVEVHAKPTNDGAVIAGVAAVASSSEIDITFAPGALPPGVYYIRARATVAGQPAQTFYARKWTCLDSFAPTV